MRAVEGPPLLPAELVGIAGRQSDVLMASRQQQDAFACGPAHTGAVGGATQQSGHAETGDDRVVEGPEGLPGGV